jgi:hypothetical protein
MLCILAISMYASIYIRSTNQKRRNAIHIADIHCYSFNEYTKHAAHCSAHGITVPPRRMTPLETRIAQHLTILFPIPSKVFRHSRAAPETVQVEIIQLQTSFLQYVNDYNNHCASWSSWPTGYFIRAGSRKMACPRRVSDQSRRIADDGSGRFSGATKRELGMGRRLPGGQVRLDICSQRESP